MRGPGEKNEKGRVLVAPSGSLLFLVFLVNGTFPLLGDSPILCNLNFNMFNDRSFLVNSHDSPSIRA